MPETTKCDECGNELSLKSAPGCGLPTMVCLECDPLGREVFIAWVIASAARRNVRQVLLRRRAASPSPQAGFEPLPTSLRSLLP